MNTVDRLPTPSIVDAQLAFEHWRSTRSGRERTPEHLKALVGALLEHHSVGHVCKALAINSGALKQWKLGSPCQFVPLPEPDAQNDPFSPSTLCGANITLPNGVHIQVPANVPLADVIHAAYALHSA